MNGQEPARLDTNFPRRFTDWLRLIFGVSQRVTRVEYALVGVTLMTFKYAVEALAVWHFASATYMPWDFVNPLLTVRTQLLAQCRSGSPGRCSSGRCRFYGLP